MRENNVQGRQHEAGISHQASGREASSPLPPQTIIVLAQELLEASFKGVLGILSCEVKERAMTHSCCGADNYFRA